MATSTTESYDYIPDPPTACIFADLRYGTNGDSGGTPEIAIGNNASDASTGRITWDDNEGAFDSGQVNTIFALNAGGGVSAPDTIEVEGALSNPTSYSLSTYGTITTIVLVVGVQTNGSAAFISPSMHFYKAGVLTETYAPSSGIAVDTTTSGNPVAAQVMTITPANSDNDKVVIDCPFRITAPEGSYPDVNDLFGQIFVQTSTCSS